MAKTNYRTKIRKYLKDLSQRGYQPGGGSAGALAFCLGAALLVKAMRHSFKKDFSFKQKNKLKKQINNISGLKKEIYPYIDQDGEVFSAIMESHGKAREKKLKQGKALIKHLAKASKQAFLLAKEIESDIKNSIKSDFYLGIEFIKVAQLSADLNLKANRQIFKQNR